MAPDIRPIRHFRSVSMLMPAGPKPGGHSHPVSRIGLKFEGLCRELPPAIPGLIAIGCLFSKCNEAGHRFVDCRHCLRHIDFQVSYKMTYLGRS
jgi:hypothetical protein